MIKTFTRIWKNLKWLFNHPPTTYIELQDKSATCDYCKMDENLTRYMWHGNSLFTICHKCLHKVCDSVLKEKI